MGKKVMKVKKLINNKILNYMFYFAFLCCAIFTIYLYFRPIQNVSVTASYDTSAQRFYTDFEKNAINYFECDINKLNSISLFLGKESNIKNIHVSLFDENNNIIYENEFKNIVGDVVTFNFPMIEDSMGKKYKLLVDSNESFHIYTTLSKNNNNYLEGYSDNTFVFTMSGYKGNYFYMWYPIMMIGIMLPFYIMIGGCKDVKKNR